ncbi:MAG: hypothetical protein FJZ01_11905 [Candidatus Sericytochromatia bacterium]|nr:hypothetical protein [Candidatus Tanganyikabacteria bacterium]
MHVESGRAAIRRQLPSTPATALLDPEATRALTRRIKEAVAMSPAEERALAGLPPEQRRQYAQVAAKLDGADRTRLERLLIGQKLDGARDLQMQGDLLANLARLATEPLGPGIDRRDLLARTIRGIADPGSITQGDALTCGAAAAQIMLARQNPAEYVRILAGLASAEGKVRLADGNVLSRQAGWERAAIPGRANQLMQTAFMAHAAGGYDAANDLRADGQKGLYASEVAFLQEGLLGKAMETVEGNSDDVLARIAKQANAGKPVSVLMKNDQGAHYVQVTRVEGDKLTYVDPRDGQEHTVDAAGFGAHIQAANLEAPEGTKVRKARPTDHKGVLGGGCFLVDAIKAVAKAVVSVVKAVVDTVVKIVKKVAEVVAKVAKAVVSAIATIAKVLWEGIKKIGEFVWKNLGIILTIAQIVCMFVPGLQVVSLAIAAYQGIKSGVAIYNGIKNGDWMGALMGGIGLVTSFAGGVGALGAKVAGQGLATAANVAGKVANVAGNVANAARAIERGDWGSLVASVASGVAAGAGFVSDKAAAVAEKWAGYAHKFNGVYQAAVNKDVAGALGSAASVAGDLGTAEFGMDAQTAATLGKVGTFFKAAGGVQRAAHTGDALAIADAGLGLVQTTANLGDRGKLGQQTQKSLGILDKAVGYGKQALAVGSRVVNAARNYGTAAVLGVLGAGAALGGYKYATMTDAERADLGRTLEGYKDAFLETKVGKFATHTLGLVEAWGRAQNLSDTALRTGYLDTAAVTKNQERLRQSARGLGDLFGLIGDKAA